LNLSYEKGFRAYYLNCASSITCALKESLTPFFAKEIPEHVLVNNWANGWLVTNGNQIAIIFLPQYFEYLGFIVLFVPVLIIVLKVLASKASKNRQPKIDLDA
jgi:hypothetical protein